MPMGGALGIKAHEWWAYFAGTTHPAVKVLVIDPGRTYGSDIRIRYEDDDAFREFYTKRNHLPCKWEDLDDYLEQHPERPRAGDVATTATPQHIVHTTNELRSIIHEEIHNALGISRLAYTYEDAAIATGVSRSTLYAAVNRNELVPRYSGTKPLFTLDELQRWLASLPDEPRRSSY